MVNIQIISDQFFITFMSKFARAGLDLSNS